MRILQRPETLGSAVVAYIHDAVLRGEYPPGSQLPELTLADRLQVSRGTVREALRALAEIGLVEVFPHRGAFVPELTVQRAREIYGLRMVLEPYAIEQAFEAGQIGPKTVTELRAAYKKLERAAKSGDTGAVIEADMAFHECLSGLSGNETLRQMLNTLQVQTRLFILYTKLYASDLTDEVANHEPIMAALERGDRGALQAAVRDHVRESGELLVGKMLAGGEGADMTQKDGA